MLTFSFDARVHKVLFKRYRKSEFVLACLMHTFLPIPSLWRQGGWNPTYTPRGRGERTSWAVEYIGRKGEWRSQFMAVLHMDEFVTIWTWIPSVLFPLPLLLSSVTWNFYNHKSSHSIIIYFHWIIKNPQNAITLPLLHTVLSNQRCRPSGRLKSRANHLARWSTRDSITIRSSSAHYSVDGTSHSSATSWQWRVKEMIEGWALGGDLGSWRNLCIYCWRGCIDQYEPQRLCIKISIAFH